MQFEVISNQSPYKRIEIGAREWPKVVEPDPVACYAMPAPTVWGAVVEAMEAEYGPVTFNLPDLRGRVKIGLDDANG